MERRNALSAPERLLLWVADSFRIGSFRLVADEGRRLKTFAHRDEGFQFVLFL